MKLKTALCATFLGLSVLACGGGDFDWDMPEGVEVTAPWADKNLPIGDGMVVASDSYNLTISYNTGSADSHFASFSEALQAQGYSPVGEVERDDFEQAQSFERDGQQVRLATSQILDIVSVRINRM